jgi:hypothetical protein
VKKEEKSEAQTTAREKLDILKIFDYFQNHLCFTKNNGWFRPLK